jgi:hypothetical protein
MWRYGDVVVLYVRYFAAPFLWGNVVKIQRKYWRNLAISVEMKRMLMYNKF